MSVISPWVEHFNHFEADEFRPLLDSQNALEHYCQVREVFALGRSSLFEVLLNAPIGKKFPPTALLRSLLKEREPEAIEWPDGIFPSIAVQCQFVLLLALAGKKELAVKLAKQLAPIVSGGFWTLWTSEKEYNEEETRLSCALFLQAIGKTLEADELYSPALPNSPFFSFLHQQKIQLEIPPFKEEKAVWTLEGSKASIGAMKSGSSRILAFGPHAHPLTNSNLFGICQAEGPWFCSSAQKDVWFQVEKQAETAFALYSFGISFEKPMAFVFYVEASECRIGNALFKPKSLQRFSGEASTIHFDGMTLEIDRPLKIELIPLAGSKSYWGSSFLLAFWLSPLSNKVFFALK